MEVALSALVPLNGGDMAIAQALASAVRRSVPGVRLQMRSGQARAAAGYYPDENWVPSLGMHLRAKHSIPGFAAIQERLTYRRLVTGRRWLLSEEEREHLDELAKADVVVSTGGTYLVEQYRLMRHAVEWEAAMRLGLPVIFYTQSLGPFTNRKNRDVVLRTVGRSPLVLLRDERSRRHLLDIGVSPTNLHVAADAAFAWASEKPKFRLPELGRGVHIGISVRQWPVGAVLDAPPVRRFAGAIGEAITQLVRALPTRVTFVSTCQGAPEYWIDDSKLALAIAKELAPDVREHVEVDTDFHTPTEFLRIAGECDVLIATRMHAAILSLAAGTPVIPIAYEFKTVELFEDMRLGDLVLDIGTLTSAEIVDSVEALVRGGTDVLTLLEQGVARQRASALEAERMLGEQLLRSA